MAHAETVVARSLCLAYRSGGFGEAWKVVLHDVDLALSPGEVGVLVGANGSGKTTLLRALVGLLTPQHGTICVNGKTPARSRIAYLTQTRTVLPWRRAIDDVTVLLEIAGVARAARERVAVELMKRFGFDTDLGTRNYRLSVGQQQKVAICRTLAASPYVDLLVLDEPTNHLDEAGLSQFVAEFAAILREITCPVVVATHSSDLVRELGGRRFLLRDGQVREARLNDATA